MVGIDIKGLEKRYMVNDSALEVLRGVNLELEKGTITVVLGKSGCGKTTLLRLIGGLEQPSAGEIRFSEPQKAAYVFQEPRLMPWLNVHDNVRFGLKHGQYDAADISRIIETVGLTGFEKARPAQLSGGMQQRAALARALAYQPSFILMDEPFASLDHFTRENIQRELLGIWCKTDASILFVTHSIDEALILANKIVLLSRGIITREFQITSQHPRNLLSDDLISARREIMFALAEAE